MVDDPTPVAGARLGHDVNATTQPGHAETRVDSMAGADAPTLVPSTSAAAAAIVSLPPPGYELGDQIGRGGMGEVLVAHDLRIGREVAVKRMNAERPSSEQTTRFLREARIQARLEHPAIVPVHELGVDDRGRLYFTMKRLAGKTFGVRIAEGLSLATTLRSFVDVCLAVEFAHARGVVHRDLKPSNIMLGDYGEVYVIDWGIARIADEDTVEKISETDISTLEDNTKSGALLGTPGYMAPEQLRGQRVTNAADVYALGAILFEILAGEPLHRRGEAGIASTLAEPQMSPAERRKDRTIAPELDAACFDALAEVPERRPTARALADRVSLYLDGDRDVEQRRRIARDQIAAAHAALASSVPTARATAFRCAGRALALDPESEEAAQLVSSLLLEPPATMPADCERGYEEYEATLAKDRSRQAQWTYSAAFLLLPTIAFVQINNWGLLIGFYGAVILGLLATQRSKTTGRTAPLTMLVVNLAIVIAFSRVAGPYVLTPLFICGALIAFVSVPWINDRPWVVVAWSVTAVLAPLLLEATTSLTTTTFHEGMMVVRSNILQSTGRPTAIALAGASVILSCAVGLFVLRVTRRRREAQRQLYVQAWHLRQLLPAPGSQPK